MPIKGTVSRPEVIGVVEPGDVSSPTTDGWTALPWGDGPWGSVTGAPVVGAIEVKGSVS